MRLRSLDVIRNPARIIVVAYATLIILGSFLLRLPVATAQHHLDITDALFMSTSASTITGLSSIDHGTLTTFGEVVIIVLVQIGGFGIMTIGSMLALVTARHLGLRQRMLTMTEIGADEPGEVRALLAGIAKMTIVIESVLAVVLFLAFWASGDESAGGALYDGVFHSISSFNNAGFSTFSGGLTRFVGNPFVILPITFGFILGGLGFPVFTELIRRRRHHRDVHQGSIRALPWSIHTRVTVLVTLLLVIVGPIVVMLFEWTNTNTLGELDLRSKLLASWLEGVTPRSAGFSAVPTAGMNDTTLVVITMLMFVGAGSVSTGGGIKVTTFALLGAVMWSEVRGQDDTNILRRRIPASMARQALTVALLAIGLIAAATIALMAIDGFELLPAMFEITSAFGTAGLSVGVTEQLNTLGHYLIMALMLVGRVGVVTFVTAIALTDRARAYRLPEERLIIG